MIDTVAELIDSVHDVDARPRLRRCLPSLSKVLASFNRRSASQGLVIAAATPNGATVLAADGWPELAASKHKPGDVVLALSAAIENAESDAILIGIATMLGRRGLAAQADDAALIRADGKLPMVVALLEYQRGSVTLLLTTVAASVPVATVH